jgi:prolyl 4-hydroxylase
MRPFVHATLSFFPQEEWRGEAILLSTWAPRATLYKSFLTEAECTHLKALAAPTMEVSSVVDSVTGIPAPSAVRSSTGTFLNPAADAVVARIERRLALITHIPVENGEALQVLHYTGGAKYEPHLDAFSDAFNSRAEAGGQRVATVLMFLESPEVGGETVFPNAGARAAGPGWSECAREGLAVKPVAGDALLFWSTTPDGAVDPASLHGSCPTTRGSKWTATRWLHGGAFGDANPAARARAGECVDGSPDCAAWAAGGECARNPGFMLATCRVSCKSCGGGEGGGSGGAAVAV